MSQRQTRQPPGGITPYQLFMLSLLRPTLTGTRPPARRPHGDSRFFNHIRRHPGSARHRVSRCSTQPSPFANSGSIGNVNNLRIRGDMKSCINTLCHVNRRYELMIDGRATFGCRADTSGRSRPVRFPSSHRYIS
jgi:hypothetical protein